MVVENAFGCLMVPGQVKWYFYHYCICEINKEHFLPEWNTEQPDLPEPDQTAYQGVHAHGHQANHEAIMSIH